MSLPFNLTIQFFVTPDLIGGPWSALSCLRNSQAMDSRLRGNDKVVVAGESAQ